MQLPYSIRTLGHRMLGGVRVRVRSGINQGYRWSLVTTGRGYGSGTFGCDRLGALQALVQPGETFFDLGAHKGFMALAASRMVGRDGIVVAVEPGTSNLGFLRRHLEWNRVQNVRVVQAAVGAESGTVAFGGRGDSLAYQVGVGDETVPLKSIPQIVAEERVPPPTVIKMDIEGHELEALTGGLPVLGPEAVLLISIHSRALYDDCSQLLENAGFKLFPSHEIRRRTSGELGEWGGDHDLLAIGSGRSFDPPQIEGLPLMTGP
ncbi:MAG: FkbM family methyltransferase [Gemmatimonadota bacterium]